MLGKARLPLKISAIGAIYILSKGNEARQTKEANMTNAEQSLADDKMRTEIAKLLAETKQIGVSTFLAPFLAAAGLMGATAALVKIFLG